MAVLNIDELSLEIAYSDFRNGWVHYEIWARLRDVPLINDAILKSSEETREGRRPGAFLTCELRGCGILPMIRRVLETYESSCWEGTEPGVALAIYTDRSFPFLAPPMKEVDRSGVERALRPDDYVELILQVDLINFRGCDGLGAEGPAYVFASTFGQLGEFYRRLREEYVAFSKERGIDASNRQDLGAHYEDPWF